MNEVRIGAAAVFCDDKLFVFGGEKESVPTQKTSRNYGNSFCFNYEIYDGAWRPHPLYEHSYFAALAIGNKIYLIGCYTHSDPESSRSIEYEKKVSAKTRIFCPSKATWKIVGLLNAAKASFSSAVLN